MKIIFDTQGNNYIEMIVTTTGKYQLSIAVQDTANSLISTVNSVELTRQQLVDLVSELGLTFQISENKG